MKILHLLNTSTYSGAENVAITIINNIKSDYKAAYCSPDGPIRTRVENENITFIPVSKMNIIELKKVVQIYKPDIIHAHDFTTSIVATLINSNTPIISHLHKNPPWLKKYGIYSLIYLLSSRRFEKILGVSNSIFEEYVFTSLIQKKIEVVSNPIDVNFIREKVDTFNYEKSIKNQDVVFIGRLSEEKSPLKFIELVNIIRMRIPNIRVAIIGNGILEEQCKNKISELNLEQNIKMYGFISNPYEILSQSKILCMTSKWEGFGLVAVEALSLGVPVVATPVGGLPEIITDKSGLLTLNETDYVDEVIKLVENPCYLKVKSKNSIDRSNTLNNINHYITKITDTYISSLR